MPLDISSRSESVSANRERRRAAGRMPPRRCGPSALPVLCRAQGGHRDQLGHLAKVWAVAARMNSSRAPFGPRRRRRSNLRMRLRCANSISIFLRSRREVRPSHDLAIWRHVASTLVDRARHLLRPALGSIGTSIRIDRSCNRPTPLQRKQESWKPESIRRTTAGLRFSYFRSVLSLA
jgi:hypothetical protein